MRWERGENRYKELEGWKWRIQGGIVMEDTGRAREGCGGYRKGE